MSFAGSREKKSSPYLIYMVEDLNRFKHLLQKALESKKGRRTKQKQTTNLKIGGLVAFWPLGFS